MIDSHAHLEMEAFDPDREDVIRRAHASGVETILSLGLLDEAASYRKAFGIVDGNARFYTSIGCHPHDAKIFGEDGEDRLGLLTERERLVAIGEIGLDYHYNLSPPPVQRDVFRRQIRVARRLALPLIIHQREASADLVTILDEEKAGDVGGVLHSFTAELETARAALDRGFYISFSGILTFKNAGPLREVARSVPLERMLIETDCPYLAPVPHRGKRNEPSFVWEVAKLLAELKQVSLREIEDATTANFKRLFSV